MDLSPDQQLAFDRCLDFGLSSSRLEPDNPRILRCGGYAGSGKTTVMGHLAKALQDAGKLVAYATFTGRASGRLLQSLAKAGVAASNRQAVPSRRNGEENQMALGFGEMRMPFCGTLHRLLYAAIIDQATDECRGYRKRTKADREYDLIVIDEASMVGDEMLIDIKRFGIKILAVGDHGQLRPVGDCGSLMANPDIRLEKIHRQAEGNPIIQLAHAIREAGRIDKGFAGDAIRFGSRKEIGRFYLDAAVYCIRAEQARTGADAVPGAILDVGALCFMNRTRIDINRQVRKALAYDGPPKDNETVMCVRNTQFGVFNGMRGIVVGDSTTDDWEVYARLSFPQEDVELPIMKLCGYQLHREKPINKVEEMQRQLPGLQSLGQLGMLCDYGYAATVHKFQGSGIQHAIWVIDRNYNTDDSDWRRFAYTAVTRAISKLTILT